MVNSYGLGVHLQTEGSHTMTRLSNVLAHAGRPSAKGAGRMVNMPIEPGSTVVFDTVAAFEAARSGRYTSGTLYYGRYGTEASFALEAMFAEMEGAHGCVLASSGVAAMSMALAGVTRNGDHVLVADNVYGNTRGFCDTALVRQGIEIEYFDPAIGGDVEALMRKNTAAVVFEAPGSGTFEVPDIPAIADAARRRGAVSILDGTWATPLFCRPLALGVDVVVHSGSKYVCGHSDAMIGLIACGERAYEPIRRMACCFGDKPGAQEVFLALRGLRTLQPRMRAAEEAGFKVARWLAAQPQVLAVLHPGLEACPGHAFWKRDFSGAASLFSVLLKPCPDAQLNAFVESLRLFGIGVSWGGFESLALPVKPHRTARPWTREGQLVRFAIGAEDTDSLIEDLAQGLEGYAA